MKKCFFLLCCVCIKTAFGQNISSVQDSSKVYSFVSAKDSIPTNRTIYSIERDSIAVEVLQNWNSTKGIWENTERHEKVLDKNGMQTLDALYKWYNEKKAWYEFAKTERKYDGNKKLLLSTSYQASGEVGRWVLDKKYEYTYDERGNNLSELNYEWNYSWKMTVKMLKTYNAANKVVSEEYYQWDKDRAKWGKNVKTVSTYDVNNNETQKLLWRGTSRSDDWNLQSKNEYQYNQNGKVISDMSYEYMWQKKIWLLTRKEEYSFGANDRYLTHTIYGYHATINALAPLTRYEQEYNASGKVSLATTSEWDSQLKKWSKLEQYEDTYDDKGNMILMVHYHKNFTPVLHKLDKTEIIYEGEKKTTYLYSRDEKRNDLRIYSKLEEVYSNGKLISQSTFTRDHITKTYFGETKVADTFNSSGSVSLTQNYSWDTSTNDWRVTLKTYNYSH